MHGSAVTLTERNGTKEHRGKHAAALSTGPSQFETTREGKEEDCNHAINPQPLTKARAGGGGGPGGGGGGGTGIFPFPLCALDAATCTTENTDTEE